MSKTTMQSTAITPPSPIWLRFRADMNRVSSCGAPRNASPIPAKLSALITPASDHPCSPIGSSSAGSISPIPAINSPHPPACQIPKIGSSSRQRNISTPCTTSLYATALKPPMLVYSRITAAPSSTPPS